MLISSGMSSSSMNSLPSTRLSKRTSCVAAACKDAIFTFCTTGKAASTLYHVTSSSTAVLPFLQSLLGTCASIEFSRAQNITYAAALITSPCILAFEVRALAHRILLCALKRKICHLQTSYISYWRVHTALHLDIYIVASVKLNSKLYICKHNFQVSFRSTICENTRTSSYHYVSI